MMFNEVTHGQKEEDQNSIYKEQNSTFTHSLIDSLTMRRFKGYLHGTSSVATTLFHEEECADRDDQDHCADIAGDGRARREP